MFNMRKILNDNRTAAHVKGNLQKKVALFEKGLGPMPHASPFVLECLMHE